MTDIVWRNPHVRFTLATSGDQSDEISWEVESIPVTRLTRVGISQDMIQLGDTVRIAGFPARRPVQEVYAITILLADGREALLDTPTPRWTEDTVGTGTDATPGEASADKSLGIFRVWSTDGSFLRTETRFIIEGGGQPNYPLTDAARTTREAWDPLDPSNPFLTCTPKGMPIIMQQPNPVEFVDEGEVILFRMEEFDTVRRIAMTAEVSTQRDPPTRLGHSVGRWEENALVVETTGIDWSYFDQNGLRQTDAVETLERFMLDDDGSRLDYEVVVTDPGLFTEPVMLSKSWRWVPGDEVLPFDCTESRE